MEQENETNIPEKKKETDQASVDYYYQAVIQKNNRRQDYLNYPIPWKPDSIDDEEFLYFKEKKLKIAFIEECYGFVKWRVNGIEFVSNICSKNKAEEGLDKILSTHCENMGSMRIYESKTYPGEWRIAINLEKFQVPAIQNDKTVEGAEQLSPNTCRK